VPRQINFCDRGRIAPALWVPPEEVFATGYLLVSICSCIVQGFPQLSGVQSH